MIDLHTHTNFSDGSLSPAQLVEEALRREVGVLAITDHDEVGAVGPALTYAKDRAIEIVSGVELSIDYELQGKAHLHLLGLFVDHNNEPLRSALFELKSARRERMLEMVSKINALGYPVGVNEIEEQVGYGSAGRPHLASIMVKKGYVTDLYEAFVRYLSKGRPAYVPKKKLKIEPAINLIHSAGGLAILAHPFSLGYDVYDQLGREILKLKETGLDGIEVYYSNHDRYLTQWLHEFALKNDLLMSGGSDFHGAVKPEINLGRGLGNLQIPFEIYKNLKDYLQRNNKPAG